MWTPDDFPGADNVPWPLLIRARFVHELDAVLASQVTLTLASLLPTKVAVGFSRAATRAVTASPQERVDGETRSQALVAFEDYWDWCGTKWPGWPRPRQNGHEMLAEFGDPLAIATIGRARELIAAAGSPELQKGLDGAFDEALAAIG